MACTWLGPQQQYHVLIPRLPHTTVYDQRDSERDGSVGHCRQLAALVGPGLSRGRAAVRAADGPPPPQPVVYSRCDGAHPIAHSFLHAHVALFVRASQTRLLALQVEDHRLVPSAGWRTSSFSTAYGKGTAAGEPCEPFDWPPDVTSCSCIPEGQAPRSAGSITPPSASPLQPRAARVARPTHRRFSSAASSQLLPVSAEARRSRVSRACRTATAGFFMQHFGACRSLSHKSRRRRTKSPGCQRRFWRWWRQI